VNERISYVCYLKAEHMLAAEKNEEEGIPEKRCKEDGG
jgi:hypothetical protein